jgi:hypothetical protein
MLTIVCGGNVIRKLDTHVYAMAVQQRVAECGCNIHRLNCVVKYKFVHNFGKVYVNQMGNLGMDSSTIVSVV